jgi:hypothetical protein
MKQGSVRTYSRVGFSGEAIGFSQFVLGAAVELGVCDLETVSYLVGHG